MSNFNAYSSERIDDEGRSGIVLDHLDEFFWIYDPRDRRFIYVGAEFTKIWAQPRAPLYESHDTYFAAIHPEDRERVRSAFCSDGSGAYDESFRICRPDGTQCWVRDRAFPLLEQGERFSYMAGLATDLSALVGPSAAMSAAVDARDERPEKVVEASLQDEASRAQMARQLEAAKAQLAQAQKMELVGQLAGGIAHDFNNLLSVIMSCAHFIDVELPDDSHLRDDTEKIVHASESAASLVHRLLAFAREEVHADEIVEPGLLLEQVRPLLERTLPSEISLDMRCEDNLGDVEISSVELEQVVINLGVNARDAMPEGGELTIEASNVDTLPAAAPAELRSRPRSYVRIRVSDTGVGMDEAIRARIFEPFFTTKSKGYGTGLGLATVADLVERNHGFIRVDSSPGAGSVFDIFFPAASPQTPAGTDKTTIPIPATGDERILVLDDDPEVRQLVRRILETGGYTIVMADDTDHALELLERGLGIDLFLTDVLMPSHEGPTSVERVHAIRPDVPVLHTSSFVDDVQTRQIVRDQEAFFLAKPITPDSLLSKVREVLTQSNPASST